MMIMIVPIMKEKSDTWSQKNSNHLIADVTTSRATSKNNGRSEVVFLSR